MGHRGATEGHACTAWRHIALVRVSSVETCDRDHTRHPRRGLQAPRAYGDPRCGPPAGVGAITPQQFRRSGTCVQFSKAGYREKKNDLGRSGSRSVGRVRSVGFELVARSFRRVDLDASWSALEWSEIFPRSGSRGRQSSGRRGRGTHAPRKIPPTDIRAPTDAAVRHPPSSPHPPSAISHPAPHARPPP